MSVYEAAAQSVTATLPEGPYACMYACMHFFHTLLREKCVRECVPKCRNVHQLQI